MSKYPHVAAKIRFAKAIFGEGFVENGAERFDFVHADIEEVLAGLSQREIDVLTLSFGLEDDEERKPVQVGEILNLENRKVSEIKANALQKLKTFERRMVWLSKEEKQKRAEMQEERIKQEQAEYAEKVSWKGEDTLIENLQLSTRAYNALKRAHIDTVLQLVNRVGANLFESSIYDIANLDEKTKKSIINSVLERLHDVINLGHVSAWEIYEKLYDALHNNTDGFKF